MTYLKMKDLDLKGKRVLIRVDFNVPIKNNKVTSEVRIDAALNTIMLALEKGASVILMSHLGRPEEGKYDSKYSLDVVARCLSDKIKKPVRFERNWLDGISIQPGEVVMCDNVRFNIGEKKNNTDLAKKIAKLCDIFVMDAFATSHRAHASTYGVAQYAPIACAGLLLDKELEALTSALKTPQKPAAAIIGGSKISTKLTVLHNLLEKVDTLVVGGGIGITFIASQGYEIGNSIVERDLIPDALEILEKAKKLNVNVPLPVDVRIAKKFDENEPAIVRKVGEILPDDEILDIGPETANIISKHLAESKTILWNGPVGVFEFDNFSKGTEQIGHTIADSDAYSVAGGGDTIAAIEKFNIEKNISYISTAGGAFLEFIEGRILPAVDILEKKAIEACK